MSIKRRDFIKGSAAGLAGAAMGRCSDKESSKSLPHRYIDKELCIGCGSCVPLCPMGAIRRENPQEGFALHKQSEIDPHECAECGVCYRSRVCPVDAIKEGDLQWPRTLRSTFSNPLDVHEATGVAGRGTEGIKTNDVTERYREGYMGVFIELGRPALGTRFRDVERVVKKFKRHGFQVVKDNPVASLIGDSLTGALKPELLDEKCISVLVEFVLPDTAVQELMTIVRELAREVDTVFNLSIALRSRPDSRSPLRELFGPEVFRLPNGKVNLGMASGIIERET